MWFSKKRFTYLRNEWSNYTNWPYESMLPHQISKPDNVAEMLLFNEQTPGETTSITLPTTNSGSTATTTSASASISASTSSSTATNNFLPNLKPNLEYVNNLEAFTGIFITGNIILRMKSMHANLGFIIRWKI